MSEARCRGCICFRIDRPNHRGQVGIVGGGNRVRSSQANTPSQRARPGAPAFKSACLRARAPNAKTPWLAERDGPAPQEKSVTADGGRYVIHSFRKTRDCGDDSAVVLDSPTRKVVYRTVHERGKTTSIGDPPPAAAELTDLWKKEWRSTPK